MPPKRAASGAAASVPAKRSKKAAAPAPPAAPEIPKSKRWSAVSASANVDAEFKLAVRDPEKAYAWICICPRSSRDDVDDEDDLEDDEDEDEAAADDDDDDDDSSSSSQAAGKGPRKGKTRCDAGRTCICHKPADDHPEHEWVMTYAGFRKWISQLSMSPLRDPDVFEMYTYNDRYGTLEIIENLFLDFTEASSWKEQWVVCEALIMFVSGQGFEITMLEDGDRVDDVAELTGRLFLAMLARLERERLLRDQSSEVRNLGLIMSLFINLASDFREASLLEDHNEETVDKSSPMFNFKPGEFDGYILAYANKFAITLGGPENIDELVAELDTNAKLPASGEDPWGWDSALKKYSKNYAVKPAVGRGKARIGGDNLDITTWSSADRKQYSFNGKDPLTKKDIEALKSGKIMQLV